MGCLTYFMAGLNLLSRTGKLILAIAILLVMIAWALSL